ncbi:MAG: hypothetical protein JNM25_14840 [Planctomycetes bacterium]|nr:hypothetical protein [Planctomycetota bacterium]
MRSPTTTRVFVLLAATASLTPPATAQAPAAVAALTPPRITQAMLTSGTLPLDTIRTHGLRMFATPFRKADGYGDGPMNPLDPTSPGGRPTLQNNGTFLRINGLDAQTCMECHSIVSAATVPFTFGIGGVGGANNNAMAMPTAIDVSDAQGNGFAAFNGRFINPPFLFGAGGIELIGKEMTTELQARKQFAQQHPNTPVPLVTKGVDFGTITYAQGVFDTSQVVGIDADLVVRPFGRKGEFRSTRDFDVSAMQFHFGLQPVEVVGTNDADGDGVTLEVLVGELSALSIFATTLERPVERPVPGAHQGRQVFAAIGCVDCHRPRLDSSSPLLTYSFPEVPDDPAANPYYAVDLRAVGPRFAPSPGGGIRVECFSDLKRHDMGPGLAESNGGPLASQFVTARLWGVADTAPYLHDGRALTLSDAILMHGGEALPARNAFAGLPNFRQEQLLAFLKSLRTPRNPADGLDTSTL